MTSAPTSGDPPPDRRLTPGLLAAWGLLGAALFFWTFLWTRHEQQERLHFWETRLVSLAEDRARSIESWLAERRGDARVLAAFSVVRQLVGGGTEARRPFPLDRGAQAREAFDEVVEAHRYRAIWAVSSDQTPVASSSGAPPLAASDLALAAEAAAEKRVAILPFGKREGRPSLGFVAPVFEPGERAGKTSRGAILLMAQAERELYPRLALDIPESETDQTFLVRRLGDGIEFLSPVRRAEGHLPLLPLAAAAALRGEQGFREYQEANGAGILTATRFLPDPQWGLVVSVDRSEALAPWNRIRKAVWTSVLGLFLFITGVGIAWWRTLQAARYREISERDARYRSLLEETRDAVAAEVGGRVVYANPAFLRLFDRNAGEVLNKPLHLLFAPESREKLLEVRTALFDRDPAPETFEVVALAANGSRFDVEIRAALIELAGQEGTQITLRDITRRKRAEVRLRRSEERYRLLFERNLAGVYRSDISGRLLDCNEAFARILGFSSREEALEHPTTSYYLDPEDRSRLIARLLAEKALTNVEVRLRKKNGEPVWVLMNETLARADDGSLSAMEGTIVDISARLRAEETIRESEERFRRLADATFEGIAITENGKILDANREFARMFGYEHWELIGKPALDLVAPKSQELVASNMRAGYDKPYEAVCRRKNGSLFPVEAWGRPFPYQGRTVRVTAVRDITERRRAEQALRQSEETYRDLVEGSGALICLHDLEGRILAVNAAVAATTGYGQAALVGRNIREFLPEKKREAFDEYVEQIRAERTVEGLITVVTRQGEKRTWHYRNSLRAEGSGTPVVRGVAIDVTEQRRAEKALRESEALYHTVTDTATEGIITIDEKSTILFVNPAAERIFGYTREEMLGEKLTLLMPESLRRLHETGIERYRGTGERHLDWRSMQFPGLHKDGREIPLEISFGELLRDGKRVFTGILRDVSERARTEEALRRSEERYRLLFERNLAGVYRSTSDGRLIECNEAFARMMGYASPEEALEHRAEAFHDSPREREEFLSCLRAEGSLVNFESRNRRKDGSPVWVLENVTLIPGDGERPETLEGTVVDITERRRAEEEARLLLETTLAIGEAEDFDTALSVTLRNICEATGWILGQAWIPRADGSVLECSPAWHSSTPPGTLEKFRILSEGFLFPPGIGLPGRTWLSRQPAWIQDVQTDSNFPRSPVAREVGLKAGMGIPVLAGDAVVAVIEFFVFERREEDEHLVRLVSAVAAQLGSVIRRKRAEQALRQSEEKYRTILENIEDGYFEVDLTGAVTLANHSLAQMLGYTLEELLRADYRAYTDEENAKKISETLRQVFETGASAKAFRCEAIHRDGTRRPLEASVSLVRDSAGKPAGFRGIVRDITERKQAEEALRHSQQKYRDIFDFAPVGIYQSLHDGTLLTANAALAAILGYETVEELLLRNLNDVYFDPEDRRELIERFELQGSGRSLSQRWKRKDGSPLWVELDAHAVKDERGRTRYFEGFVRDVSERNRAEEQTRNLQEQLAQSQKIEAVGQLAGGIAHDFNNLLTAIEGYSELLLGDLPLTDPRRSHAEEIRKAAERAASLTRQLLAYSRRQVLEPRVLDLNAIVWDLGKILRRLIGEHIELRTHPLPGLWHVKADPGQLEQAILNLAINARDAMPEGGSLTIETANVDLDEAYALNHASVLPGPYAMVAVTDKGTGMSGEVKAHIFEPFFTTKEQGKGTGLGLSTTYGIVKQSGGYIWCYSEPGHGTTFKIYLPRAEEAAAKEVPSVVLPTQHSGEETILLVEDEPEVRSLVQKILKRQGYAVMPAANPEEALLVSQKFSGEIALMVTDVVMPGRSGKQLADRLAMSRPEMKVLFMSGYTDDAIVHHGILDKGTAFLQKPFTPQALARKVREVLDAAPQEFKVS